MREIHILPVMEALLLGLLFMITNVTAEIITYNSHWLSPNKPEYLVIPKYDSHEVPHWRPGRGNSYIDLSRLKVQSACYNDVNTQSPPGVDSTSCSKSVQFDLLMFETPLGESWQDYWEDDHYCCTQELADEGV